MALQTGVSASKVLILVGAGSLAPRPSLHFLCNCCLIGAVLKVLVNCLFRPSSLICYDSAISIPVKISILTWKLWFRITHMFLYLCMYELKLHNYMHNCAELYSHFPLICYTCAISNPIEISIFFSMKIRLQNYI